MRRAALTAALVLALLAASVGVAIAAWQAAGPGTAYTRALDMPAGNTPGVSVTGHDVTVSWAASAGAVPVDGYLVRRYASGGAEQSIGAGCAGTVVALSCVESGVPAGDWTYTVTPLRANWRGAESAESATATVAGAGLTLAPATVNALPATLSGEIAGFLAGQTVSFRLDDPLAGQLLSGSISPDPVPGDGSADVSVTLPAGTADGAHSVYAIGDQGDLAAAPVSVDTSCSAPGDQVLAASRDSYVDSLAAGSNFGAATTLLARPAQLALLSQQRTLLGFDLPAVPVRCTLTAATLRLYATVPGAGRTINVFRLGGAWTEAGVTWSNAPASTGAAASSASLASPGFQAWNVLAQAQAMYAGANNGLLVKDSADSTLLSVQQVYQSREGASGSQDPQLVLSFG